VSATIHQGDALTVLRTLPDQAARCCVTSPPYWGLRDYGVSGQLGLEPTPEAYVASMVDVFQEVRRVLTDDGTLWLNMGDSYTGSGKGGNPDEGKQATNRGSQTIGVLYGKTGETAREAALTNVSRQWSADNGMAPKNLVGIPWRVAFALQVDGWYLRSDIIWHKPNPMPESVTDRPTKAHEYLFLLSKGPRYYYDDGAIREADVGADHPRNVLHRPEPSGGLLPAHKGIRRAEGRNGEGRNARTVWTIPTMPYKGAHFATFPEELARRCILAGSAPGDTVLDPFSGSGTVGQVATGNGRSATLIELNPAYIELARQRIGPMLCTVAA
jgi:DNA modification methylase